MLVLSRRPGEQILVPQCELAVTVLAVEGNTVRLGISAPADLAVYRDEVWRRQGDRTHSPPEAR
jgi:carbon storage regulator